MAFEPFRHNFCTSNIFELFEPDIVFFAKFLVVLLFWGKFWPFSESKSRVKDCLKVALESLRNYFGNVFGLERLTVWHIISSNDCQDKPSFGVQPRRRFFFERDFYCNIVVFFFPFFEENYEKAFSQIEIFLLYCGLLKRAHHNLEISSGPRGSIYLRRPEGGGRVLCGLVGGWVGWWVEIFSPPIVIIFSYVNKHCVVI